MAEMEDLVATETQQPMVLSQTLEEENKEPDAIHERCISEDDSIPSRKESILDKQLSKAVDRELNETPDKVQYKHILPDDLAPRETEVIYERCIRKDDSILSEEGEQLSKAIHRELNETSDKAQDKHVLPVMNIDVINEEKQMQFQSVEQSAMSNLIGSDPKMLGTSDNLVEWKNEGFKFPYALVSQQSAKTNKQFPFRQNPGCGNTNATELYMLREYPLFTRPQWPNEGWIDTHISAYSDQSKLDTLLEIYHGKQDTDFLFIEETEEYIFEEDDCKPKRHSSLLQTFFETNITNLSSAQHPKADQVKCDVEQMLDKVVTELQSKYAMFRGCHLSGMGSTYEGTKVGSPDEFDFLIELQPLVDMGIIKFKNLTAEKSFVLNSHGFQLQDSELRDYDILDRTFFQDIFDDFKDSDANISSSSNEAKMTDGEFIRELWYNVESKIAKLLIEYLLPGWTWLDQVPGFSTLAMTQMLMWECCDTRLFVHIDLCISLPVSFPTQVDLMEELKGVPIIGTKEFLTGNLDKPVMIFRSDGKARLTRCHFEMAIWQNIPTEDGRKTVYRIAKHVVAKYMPKKYNDEIFRMESFIPSYWIKTILFYMFVYYRKDEHWIPDLLAERLMEVFKHLESCLESKHLSSFFVPHNILKSISGALGGDTSRYPAILKEVTKITSCLCRLANGEENALEEFVKIDAQCRESNSEVEEMGLFQSLIELLYRYGYNDFADENFIKILQFKELFLKESVELTGQGKSLKLNFHGERVNIDEKIHEYWKEDDKFFCDTWMIRKFGPHITVCMGESFKDYSWIQEFEADFP